MEIIIDPRVLKIINSFNKSDLAEILRTIDLLTIYGNDTKMPVSRALGAGLFELRVLTDKWFRLIYGYHGQKAIIVHVVVKKSNKLLNKDLKLARNRIKEYKSNY